MTLMPLILHLRSQVWAGSPAKFLRELEPEEAAFIAKSAANYSELSSVHKCK